MQAVRLTAIGAIVLVGIYFVFRAIASSCSGAACDVYIPISLLLPILIFLTVALAAALATARAARGSTWFVVLLALTLVGVVGPIVALLIFRDSPDAFVAVGTALELLVASGVVVYSFLDHRPIGTGMQP